MSEYAVSVKHVSKKFKLYHEKRDSIFEAMVGFMQEKKNSEILQALDDISFDVKHGEIFGIIGPNGGGKSTLLRIISKIYVPDSGSVDVKGIMIPILALGLGFIQNLLRLLTFTKVASYLVLKKRRLITVLRKS